MSQKEPFEEWNGEDLPDDAEEQEAPLERKSLLGVSNKKMSLAKLGIFFFLLVVVAIMVLRNGKGKQVEGIVQESEKFEPANKKLVTVPQNVEKPLPTPIEKRPSEDELKRAQEQEALHQARLKSAIVIYQGGASSPAKASSSAENNTQEANVQLQPAPSDPNSQFQQSVQSGAFPKAKASSLGNLGNFILQGKLIDAVLETGVNSDLPGMVRALVSYDVYGEAGNRVLIPRGSRLIGQYNSSVRKGQARVFVIWNRVVRPDGIEVALDSGGTDPLGVAGMKGRVNNHFFQIFGTSTLLSILGAGSATAGVNTSDQNNSLATYRQEISNGFQDTSSQVLGEYAQIPPTITVKQGSLIKVLVARDLDFSEALMALYPSNKMIVVP